MIKKMLNIIACFLVFASGLHLARILTPREFFPAKNAINEQKPGFASDQALILIGKTPITIEDIDWEYQLHLFQLHESKKNLTSIPFIGNGLDEMLTPLKKEVASILIERTLLYQFIGKDPNFDISNSSRFVNCIKDWTNALDRLPGHLSTSYGQEKLKSLLCQKEILSQYLKEILFPKITIHERDIKAYYDKHPSEFQESEKATIRQIVLPSEEEAKKVRQKIHKANFSLYAKTKSITPEASKGGVLGPFAKGDLPRVFDMTFAMKVGEIRGVIKSTYGFHIIWLEKKTRARKLSLLQARKKISLKLREFKQKEEYRKWVERALNTISIKSLKAF